LHLAIVARLLSRIQRTGRQQKNCIPDWFVEKSLRLVWTKSEYWKLGKQDNTDCINQSKKCILQSAPKTISDKDFYLPCAVLHGMGHDDRITVLRNLATASAGAGATMAVMGMLMPDMQADMSIASFDMQKFATTHGRERTLGEWRRLFEKSGLKLQEVVGLQSFGKILVVRVG
jgi:O-methyltransferase domain